MIIIGDVHSRIYKYLEILKFTYGEDTIQLGDFGFEYEHTWHEHLINPQYHKILFGNHDYLLNLHKDYALNYGMYKGIFVIRGAFSIDKRIRTVGLDWFPNEEIDYREWCDKVIPLYEKEKPEIVVSHDCPNIAREHFWNFQKQDRSTTSNGLQQCFEIHQPRLWIFGHHHNPDIDVIENTKFVSLDKCEVFKIGGTT